MITKQVLKACLKPIQQRIMMMIARGVIESINDDDGMQTLKATLLAGEDKDGMERFQEFGFTSNPPAGSECVVIFPAGNREHGIIVSTNNRNFRIVGLASGESAVYTDDGTQMLFKKGGQVELTTAVKVQVNAPDVEMSGNLKVNGNLIVMGTSLLSGAVTAGATLLVQAATTLNSTLVVSATATINGLLTALGFGGLGGGPMTASVDIQTTQDVTAGGTSLSGHTHTSPNGGGTTTPPN